MRKVLAEHKYQVIMLKDINPDTSSRLKSLNPTIPTLIKASSIPRPGTNSKKRHQLKAGFFMSKAFSKSFLCQPTST